MPREAIPSVRSSTRNALSASALFALAFGVLVASASAAPVEQNAKGALGPLKQGWTEANVDAEIAGCQAGVRADSWALYLKSNQLDERNLPLGAKEQFDQGIAPLMDSCRCLTETMAREFSTKDYAGRTPAAVARVNALLGEGGACAALAPAAPEESAASGCIRFNPDPKGFPYPSIREAKSALAKLKYEGGSTTDFVAWSYYTDSSGKLAVDVYEISDDSPFGAAMVWRRPHEVEVDRMLFSSRCEGSAEQCAAFDQWVNDTQSSATLGDCPGESNPADSSAG